MQQLADKKLTDTKSNLKAVVGAVRDLELSQKYFEWLAENGDRMKVSFYFISNFSSKKKVATKPAESLFL